jgi:hypothetical protein
MGDAHGGLDPVCITFRSLVWADFSGSSASDEFEEGSRTEGKQGAWPQKGLHGRHKSRGPKATGFFSRENSWPLTGKPVRATCPRQDQKCLRMLARLVGR